jgi:hypothetical protein
MPEGTVEAYEELRRQIVQPDGHAGHLQGRSLLMGCGFAVWAQLRPAPVPVHPSQSHSSAATQTTVLDSFGAELVRLIAGLILSARQEGVFACLN